MKKNINFFFVFSLASFMTICLMYHSALAMDFELIKATIEGKSLIVYDLLKNKKDEEAKKTYAQLTDSFGKTALHWAARYGRNVIVTSLLPYSSIDLKDTFNGFTPLHFAVRDRHVDVIDTLLTNNANVNTQDNNGNTPLHCAAKKSCHWIVEQLLNAKADNSIKGYYQESPLHSAVKKIREGSRLEDQVKTVLLLLKSGIDVNSTDEFGKTPLHNVAESGNVAMINLLLDKNANPHVQENCLKRTPLHLAVAHERPEAVDRLIPVSDLGIKDEGGRTPLEAAKRGGCKEIVAQLSSAKNQ